MFELLFLLLPIAAAYGYYMGRNSYKNTHARSKTEKTNNYLQGVDFLLHNNKEKAMDEFIAYLNTEHPTFESSLALGNLFRQRGEVDRAISLHTSLANNENVEPVENELAQLELAQDFMSAGLLDRAEDILLTMVEIPRQRKSAAELLVKLYEQERDFSKAIRIGLDHRDILGASSLSRISHYYCELAQQELATSKIKEAKSHLQDALNICPNSIRARLSQAEIALRDLNQAITDGNYKTATTERQKILKLCADIAAIDPSAGMCCLDLLKKCFTPPQLQPIKDMQAYRKALEDLAGATKSAAVMVELCAVVAQLSSHSDAEFMLLSFIKEKPNIKLFSAYMGLRAQELPQEKEKEVILQLKSIVDAQIMSNSHYRCQSCGFDSSMMFWQCPSCRHWDTIRPQQSLDGD